MPLPKVEVTEHQAEVTYCTCCNKTVTAVFPSGVRELKAIIEHDEEQWAIDMRRLLRVALR